MRLLLAEFAILRKEGGLGVHRRGAAAAGVERAGVELAGARAERRARGTAGAGPEVRVEGGRGTSRGGAGRGRGRGRDARRDGRGVTRGLRFSLLLRLLA